MDFKDQTKKEESPEISIEFKYFPVVTKNCESFFGEKYKAAIQAIKKIDPSYSLEINGIVGIFEMGHREEKDERLTQSFEKFMLIL